MVAFVIRTTAIFVMIIIQGGAEEIFTYFQLFRHLIDSCTSFFICPHQS